MSKLITGQVSSFLRLNNGQNEVFRRMTSIAKSPSKNQCYPKVNYNSELVKEDYSIAVQQTLFLIRFISYIPFPNMCVLNTTDPKINLRLIVRILASISLDYAVFLYLTYCLAFLWVNCVFCDFQRPKLWVDKVIDYAAHPANNMYYTNLFERGIFNLSKQLSNFCQKLGIQARKQNL